MCMTFAMIKLPNSKSSRHNLDMKGIIGPVLTNHSELNNDCLILACKAAATTLECINDIPLMCKISLELHTSCLVWHALALSALDGSGIGKRHRTISSQP